MEVSFLLNWAQMRRIVSAIVCVIKDGLMWRDAPRDYWPHKTIYNRLA